MSIEQLDYAGCAFPVEGLGPGRRVAMWVRGCLRHCAGCIAPELRQPGEPVAIAQVIDELLPLLAQADGLTISGGEPFDQAEALVILIDALREHNDYEVLIYTGYLREEIEQAGGAGVELLQRIDILIDGPFIESMADDLQWRGSDNQRIHLLSARVARYTDAVDLPWPEGRPLQIQMLSPTRYRIIGIPRRGDLEAYRAAMSARGFQIEQEHE